MKQVIMRKNIVAFDADRKKGQVVIVDENKYLHQLNLCLYNDWVQLYDRVADDIIITQQIKNKRKGKAKK